MAKAKHFMSVAELHKKTAEFRAVCTRAGLRITPQRVAVYQALIKSKRHPPAEIVCRTVRKTLPNISLDTVNRTLLKFVKIGVASVLPGSGDPKRFDGQTSNHHHFKCTKCGRIIDLDCEPFENIRIPASITRKYSVTRKTVYLEGVCDSCKSANRQRA